MMTAEEKRAVADRFYRALKALVVECDETGECWAESITGLCAMLVSIEYAAGVPEESVADVLESMRRWMRRRDGTRDGAQVDRESR